MSDTVRACAVQVIMLNAFLAPSFMAHVKQQIVQPQTWPFFAGAMLAFVSLGGMSWSKDVEGRKASKYLNPPKHH
jgi:hypothetical protein|eukprot:CAMPEP_0181197986 /NCGR_PEP_ID=MMETSP1096-20121128/16355_1 /TAXON_ID=156174 ORGANISM="Chrysochromulina ericina, Strain CCMP281" /NCGR_SAMPLE_ID=MMETSP1096 /ASSEMBLY_ACC=CAM_ASM_000453 /LENGTH=74 /DNA_ID=CAMNT_0023287977 /DNA_START=256 /DNA_END=480 /DNA_ORIENTATION=+